MWDCGDGDDDAWVVEDNNSNNNSTGPFWLPFTLLPVLSTVFCVYACLCVGDFKTLIRGASDIYLPTSTHTHSMNDQVDF